MSVISSKLPESATRRMREWSPTGADHRSGTARVGRSIMCSVRVEHGFLRCFRNCRLASGEPHRGGS